PELSSGFDDLNVQKQYTKDTQKYQYTVEHPSKLQEPEPEPEPISVCQRIINEINAIKKAYDEKQKTIQDEQERAKQKDIAMAEIFMEELQLECVQKISHMAAFDALYSSYPIHKIKIIVPLQGYWTEYFE